MVVGRGIVLFELVESVNKGIDESIINFCSLSELSPQLSSSNRLTLRRRLRLFGASLLC